MTRRLVGALLIVLMAISSVLLWIGVPAGWLSLASQVADSSQPTMGPYVMVLVGIPATMIVRGRLLAGRCPRPFKSAEGFLRVCVLARRQRPPDDARTYVSDH
jgi:hypothetical protein